MFSFFIIFSAAGEKTENLAASFFLFARSTSATPTRGSSPGNSSLFPSKIEELPENSFKYHVDFEGLELPRDAAAIAVSRPTNPTGNVLSDEEVRRLAKLASGRGSPSSSTTPTGCPFPASSLRT